MIESLSIILSAAAGRDEKQDFKRQLTEFFTERGIIARVAIAPSGTDLKPLARRALAEQPGPVVAGGGDGTVNAVASVLIESGRPLGVLPLGTLNHFAKDLGLPLDPMAAAAVLAEGATAAIDVGEVNGRIFLNNSSVGLYPALVHQRDKIRERLEYGKWPAFAWAGLGVLRRYPLLDLHIRSDQAELRQRTPFVFIGNNEYRIEGFDLGGRERLDAGWLWLYAAPETGRLGLLTFAGRALCGRLRDQRDFARLCTRDLRIESRRKRLRVATDGEVAILPTPLHYRIRPRALQVLVPKPEHPAA
jgi:diacylglycerol kinase family enzyme